ncbi:MAG: LemA family protein [Microbacteriaceae bacterium]
MDYTLWIVIGIVALVGIWLWSTYNGLVTLNERVEEAWSDITIQLKRRADLIPNIIETVKGYAKHEKEVFESVTLARAATISPEALKSPKAAAKADTGFTGAMKSLFAVAEAYPQLQANQNFLQLQNELSDTEDKIMAARRFYNAGARELNIKIKQFPQVLFAGLGFKEREYFEVADPSAIADAPQVKF